MHRLTRQTSRMAPAGDTRWEGSRAFAPVARLAQAIRSTPRDRLTAEEEIIGWSLSTAMSHAKVVVCPPDQMDAISEDVFSDLGQAFEYAMAARLPFEVTLFDFTDVSGDAVDMRLHYVEGGGRDLGLELRAVVATEMSDERRTAFLPIIGMRGQPPEELGVAFVDWDPGSERHPEPSRWREPLPMPDGRELEVTVMSVSAAMEALGETPRSVPGALMGCLRREQLRSGAPLQAMLATSTAVAVRTAMKLLFLLDSVNIELAPTEVSRQVRRQAERSGAEIAWTVRVRPPQRRASKEGAPTAREFSHRFEVRGNFAHYGPETWLYAHSNPEDIRPCPRCGTCRRVWRAPHIKGPGDRPLAVKIRRVEFGDEPLESPPG